MNRDKKVFDCFPFFNEFDLLEIRLSYLYDVVDYFIIVEADTTHVGQKKKFNFLEHEERYKEFKDKIVYIPYEMPNLPETKKVAWSREAYQRNVTIDVLKEYNAQADDIVMMGDLDEIVNKDVIKSLLRGELEVESKSNSFVFSELIKNWFGLIRDIFTGTIEHKLRLRQSKQALKEMDKVSIVLRMDNFYYYFNNREKEKSVWKSTVWFNFSLLESFKFDDLRELRRFPLRWVNGAGWHFSYLGGKELIKHKLKNFIHQEFNIEEIVNDEYIDYCMKNGYSLFHHYLNKDLPPQFEHVSLDIFPDDLKNLLENYPSHVYS